MKLLAILPLIAVVFISGCTTQVVEQEGSVSPFFENLDEKIFMSIPVGWSLKENLNIGGVDALALVRAPEKDDFRANINIIKDKATDQKTYYNSFKTSVETRYSSSNFVMRSEGDLTIADFKTNFIEYTYTESGKNYRIKHYMVVKNGNAYVITYTSLEQNYAEFATPFEKSIRTFRFLA